MKVARKFIVKGVVQGVGYRFFTQRVAAKHGVVGYVRNLKDGSVEVLAEGELSNIENFKKDLMVGPQFAVVREIEEIVVEPSDRFNSFLVEKGY